MVLINQHHYNKCAVARLEREKKTQLSNENKTSKTTIQNQTSWSHWIGFQSKKELEKKKYTEKLLKKKGWPDLESLAPLHCMSVTPETAGVCYNVQATGLEGGKLITKRWECRRTETTERYVSPAAIWEIKEEDNKHGDRRSCDLSHPKNFRTT